MQSEKPTLAHHVKNEADTVPTHDSKTGLGIALWRSQSFGALKPNAFGRRYLTATKKKTSIAELELLVVVRGFNNSSHIYTEKKLIH